MSYIGPYPLPINGGGTAQTTFPSFCAYTSANLTNVTGDGTAYTILFDSTIFDTASGYAAGTGKYTVPVTGNYYIYTSVFMSGLTSSHTGAILAIYRNAIENYIQLANPFANSDGGDVVWSGGIILALTAADTINVVLDVQSGTKVVTIPGQALSSGMYSSFGAYLLT